MTPGTGLCLVAVSAGRRLSKHGVAMQRLLPRYHPGTHHRQRAGCCWLEGLCAAGGGRQLCRLRGSARTHSGR